MVKYIPSDIEPKWQEKWRTDKLYEIDLKAPKRPFYTLVELAYTSGDLHMGHWFTFVMGDVIARFKKMQGFDVVFPNGFDAFGLPAENAAIKNNIHPQDWTYANVERMTSQFQTMGSSIDWTKTMVACDPKYYKWNQWIFLKMFEKNLAYRGTMLSNWCPNCQTVLANENVEAGKCWRCGTEVVQKEVPQWFVRITDYADKLIWPKDPSVDWPKALREAQNQWIGRSEGVVINFGEVKVFTTRHDTIFGTTFIVISPEHPLLNELTQAENKLAVQDYVRQASKKSELERKENKDKTGVFTGSFLKNPLTNKQTAVWVADYVLAGYGTGAVMGVPSHDERDFEFAKKHGLEIIPVIAVDGKEMSDGYEGEGVLINSGEYNGQSTSQARDNIANYIAMHNLGEVKVQYHLHDWSISRQRYWGTPIPMIHCPKCGVVPVPEKDLPVELPYKVDYKPQGKPPLATAEEWMKVKCPNCGGDAERDPETMDTFVDSAWYYFRYLDPKNDQEIFDKKIIEEWMPLGIYIGGAEHTLGHALYSRFFTKFFKDIGLISFDEYAKRRIHHGTILGPDGSKMSKSKGNVVNPDEQVKEYGADSVRTYLSFLGPYDIVAAWNPETINGVYHFMQRVWGLYEKVGETDLSSKDLLVMHKTIKKVSLDIEEIKLNTAVASLMEWLNHLSKKEIVAREEYKNFILLLSPFAPHITEELFSKLGEKSSIYLSVWPKFEEKYLEEEEVTVAVQINGKVRESIKVHKDIVNVQSDVEKLAVSSAKVQKYLQNATVKRTVYIPGKVLNFVI